MSAIVRALHQLSARGKRLGDAAQNGVQIGFGARGPISRLVRPISFPFRRICRTFSRHQEGRMKPMLSVVAVVVLGLVAIPGRVVAVQDADTAVINMEPGQVMLEFVGQMADMPTTTLPGSNQFGFLSFIRGLKAIFMTDSPPFDGTTAKFGFVTRATTTREIANGPLVVITREGVTRISFTPCPWCLSPSVGIINPSLSIPVFLIQTSTLRQQVIIDNETRSFSVVSIN